MPNQPLYSSIGVIGGGAWGTALAVSFSKVTEHVMVWSRQSRIADTINRTHRNNRSLPDILLPNHLKATDNLADMHEAHLLFIVTPAQTIIDIGNQLAACQFSHAIPLVLCCKGIEQKNNQLMSEVLSSILPHHRLAILSGPNFADEVAKGLPAGATLACTDTNLAQKIIQSVGHPLFRLYHSEDIITTQIAGAAKNVLAIACGICMGRNMGQNARAALITRGIHEIGMLCEAKGGSRQALMGLCGIGDIMLTCCSEKSRNMSLGIRLGRGEQLSDILHHDSLLAEGVASAAPICALAEQSGVELPIAMAVNQVLTGDKTVGEAIASLLNRPLSF